MKSPAHLILLSSLLISYSNSQDSRSLIQEMVNAVQSDSLMKYVQALQSYGTRYEYTTQQEAAGGYILGEFARWGTQGESDWYSFGMVTFSDIDVLPAERSWVVGTAPGVSATTDGGQTWGYSGSATGNYLLGVDLVPTGIGLAVGYGGTILRTTNAGQTWQQQASGIASDLQDVSYAGERLAIAVGSGGVVLRSTDGGATWLSGSAGTANTLYEVKAVDSLTMYAVGVNGTIVRSTDGGITWSPQVSNTTNILYGVEFITRQLGWVVGAGPTIQRTTDGGVTWLTVTLATGAAQSLRGVYFKDALQGWCVDYYGIILQTTDGGGTWTKNLDLNSAGYWRPYLRKIKGNGSQHLIVCGVRNLIVTSTDNGASWVDRTANLPSYLTHTTRNIVATIQGKVTPEKECIMLAHYDSNSSDVNAAPGANDNASATSAVMEAARIMKGYEFESTVKLIAVSAEEVGLLGSAHYAFTARSQNRAIACAVNGDMVGYATTPADANRLSLGYYLSRGRLIDSALVYNQRYGLGINLTVSTQSSGGSDHVPFTVTGYDALYVLSSSADSNYHRPIDTIEKLHPGLLRRAAQLMLTAVAEMARPLRRISGYQPIPTEFTLEQNFPNPFNPGTQFRFGLARASFVTLKVYNLLGMEIATIITQPMGAGVHTIEWRPTGLASGVYLYRLQAEGFSETKKLMVLR